MGPWWLTWHLCLYICEKCEMSRLWRTDTRTDGRTVESRAVFSLSWIRKNQIVKFWRSPWGTSRWDKGEPESKRLSVRYIKIFKDLPIFHFWVQVCFEEMAPPKLIFHCVNGHFVCGGCKPQIQVWSPLQTPSTIVIFNHVCSKNCKNK